MMGLAPRRRLLSTLARCSSLAVCAALLSTPAAADDPPTEFSKKVTAIAPEWESEDWRKGTLTLHPQQYTWQSDQYLRLFAEEPTLGRTALDVARGHFDGDTLGDDTTDPTIINMSGAKEISPGILAVQYNWTYAFDRNISFYGVVATAANSYVPFTANCERDDTDRPQQYPTEKCLRNMLLLLLSVQGGPQTGGARLALPEPKAPINVAGWDGQYLKDGRSLAITGSFNGLRKAYLHVTPPRALSPNDAATALKQFSDSIIDDNDRADKNPGSLNVVGTQQDVWIRREFPDAFDGPSIQMAGMQTAPDGKISFIGIRCPNKGWLKTCAYGVEQAKQQVRSGQMEMRRQRYVAARQAPIPANGIQTAQILGFYGAAKFNGTSFVIDGALFLKDGTVYNSMETAPAMIDPQQSKASAPGDWGRWRRAGASMAVTWGDGDTDTIEATPDNLMVGGTGATRLSGLYGTVSSGGSLISGSGFVSRASYTFYPDGTFVNDRSSSFSVGGFTPGEASPTQIASGGSSASSGRARYKIDGYMISFHYPDGQIERESFAMYAKDANNSNRKYVLIGGTPYTLDDGS